MSGDQPLGGLLAGGKVRALAIDLDGTLMNSDDQLTPRNKAAVEAAVAAGIDIIVATARWYQNAERVARPLGLTRAVIACSGAEVRRLSDGADLMDLRLPLDFAADLYEILDGQRSLAWIPLDDVVLMRAEGSFDLELDELRHVPSLAAAADAAPRMALIQGTAVCQSVVEALEPKWSDQVQFLTSITHYGKTLLTLTAAGADKGVALRIACQDHGIDPSEVIAIGDSDNDIAMFRVAGASIAMGQASDEMKQLATAVTATNDEDGVAQAIERILADA
jgi:Cof subfamily protein (haloacid dehalogenase superfamily)